VHTLQLQAPELPPDILDAWNKHLATSELRPQALLLSDNPGNFSLLSASEVWQDVQTVVLGTLTGQLTEVRLNFALTVAGSAGRTYELDQLSLRVY
jgi:hypothetical protein